MTRMGRLYRIRAVYTVCTNNHLFVHTYVKIFTTLLYNKEIKLPSWSFSVNETGYSREITDEEIENVIRVLHNEGKFIFLTIRIPQDNFHARSLREMTVQRENIVRKKNCKCFRGIFAQGNSANS